VAILIVTALIFPHTFTFGGLVNLTPLLGVLVVASMGQSLVIGTGGIDLSASSVMTLAGVAFVIISAGNRGSTGTGIAVALGVGLACGVVNGLLVEGLGLNALVVTLATGQVLAGVASILFQQNADGLGVPAGWASLTRKDVGGGISYLLVGSILLAVIVSVAIRFTAFGRRFVAASVTSRAAAYLGIRVRLFRAGAYTMAAVIYSCAGVVLVGIIGTASLSFGESYQLATIVAVVLGGAALAGGRVRAAATVAGALFLSLINQNLSASGVAPGSQSVMLGVVLIVAMGAGTRSIIHGVRRRRALPGGMGG
jgi:ribose transport system permease protein